ncbi:putative gpr1 fun34 -class plasma membrane protein [Rosellinia necatrix]|uniref:Putative gpr1 fun34-class plasma membrane protein n=1 Tax=Rosellinia necatrix TaxID=77044 RepID=A0A1S8A7A6_ROSNE|nr:putative gpr1 fun34 -class plasma membrane protein [Rosellinia necatrix]
MITKHMYQPNIDTANMIAPPVFQSNKVSRRIPVCDGSGRRTHLLEYGRRLVIAPGRLEIGARQDPRRDRREAEYRRQDGVDPGREDEEGEERKAPDDEVEPDGGVVLPRRRAGRVLRRGEGDAEGEVRHLEEPEREPKHGKQPHHHHREEVPEDPFEDEGEDHRHRPYEEEYAPFFFVSCFSVTLEHGSQDTKRGTDEMVKQAHVRDGR